MLSIRFIHLGTCANLKSQNLQVPRHTIPKVSFSLPKWFPRKRKTNNAKRFPPWRSYLFILSHGDIKADCFRKLTRLILSRHSSRRKMALKSSWSCPLPRFYSALAPSKCNIHSKRESYSANPVLRQWIHAEELYSRTWKKTLRIGHSFSTGQERKIMCSILGSILFGSKT